MRQITHALLTRPPLSIKASFNTSFDLHVLSTPPAFVLSQDQTLKLILLYLTVLPYDMLFFVAFLKTTETTDFFSVRTSIILKLLTSFAFSSFLLFSLSMCFAFVHFSRTARVYYHFQNFKSTLFSHFFGLFLKNFNFFCIFTTTLPRVLF